MTTALSVNPSQSWTGMSGPPGKLAWLLWSPVHSLTCSFSGEGTARRERLSDAPRMPWGPGAGGVRTPVMPWGASLPPLFLNAGAARLKSCLLQLPGHSATLTESLCTAALDPSC